MHVMAWVSECQVSKSNRNIQKSRQQTGWLVVSLSSWCCYCHSHQLPSLLLALAACCTSAIASRDGRGEPSGDPAAAAIADALSRLVLGVAEALMASLMRFCSGAVLLFLHVTDAAEVT